MHFGSPSCQNYLPWCKESSPSFLWYTANLSVMCVPSDTATNLPFLEQIGFDDGLSFVTRDAKRFDFGWRERGFDDAIP